MALRISCALILALALAGCGTDSGGGPSIPETISGVFNTVHSTNSGIEGFGLTGYFRSAPTSTDAFYKDLLAGFPDMADGDCIQQGTPDIFASTGHLDAGEFLNLATPGGNLQVARTTFNGQVFYTSTDPSGTHFASEGNYTLSGDGDPTEVDLGPFSGSWKGPQSVSVTSPDFTAPQTIDRFVDLSITWTSTGSAPVFVSMFQKDDQNNIIHSEWCKFTDDGEGTIRSPTLDNFDETLLAVFDGISVFKISGGSFNVSGLDAPVLSVNMSLVGGAVTFE